MAKAKTKTKTKAKSRAKSKARKRKKKTIADKVDPHVLYQKSVQSPEPDLEFFTKVYRELRGKKPYVFREDFCGTAHISTTWVAKGKKRRAIGVDLDAKTLAWGRKHNIAKLPKSAQERITLFQANVLDGLGEKADMSCAMNFSYGVFKTRDDLRDYFKVVYDCLESDGVFFTELYGGTEAIVPIVDRREVDDFVYVWEQKKYNPITHETLCHIHFEFEDGSKLKKAYTYDWRLWSIPELRELLFEVGFDEVDVYWEAVEEDEDGDYSGTGEYYPTEDEENQESWLVYLVAEK